jgi:hypothetical protein
LAAEYSNICVGLSMTVPSFPDQQTAGLFALIALSFQYIVQGRSIAGSAPVQIQRTR